MKKQMILLLLICAFFLSGCEGAVIFWEFDYSYVDVAAIQVVIVYKYIYDNKTETADCKYQIVQEVDIALAEEFYSDIAQCDMFIGRDEDEPRNLSFLVQYNSGEYDILSYACVRMRYDGNGVLKANNTRLGFLMDDFDALLNKYYTE